MSNLIRSRPEQQDAVLQRIQLSSNDANDFLNAPLAVGNSDMTQELNDSLPKIFNSKLDIGIPNLTITSENYDSIISSKNSSPNLLAKNLLINKPTNVPVTPGRFSPQPSPPRLRATPPYSPKLCGRFENWPDSGAASSSPTSPSRKYFKLLNSNGMFAGGIRRGSEPLLDAISGRDLNEVKLSMTDRRWEKLRSILIAMKNEPFDPKSVQGLSSPVTLSNLKENIDTQEELSALRKEISTLHTEMKLKDCELEQALNERNVALSYVRKLKTNDHDLMSSNGNTALDLNHNKVGDTDDDSSKVKVTGNGDEPKVTEAGCNVYDKEIEMIKDDASSKEDVVNLLVHVVDELKVERSYLNHLMSVVLERAPWMLDEVDRGGHWAQIADDDGDEEVWC